MQRDRYINILKERIGESRKFIQVVTGPRQVGKTTLIAQFLKDYRYDSISESADYISEPASVWINRIWMAARAMVGRGSPEVLIVLDEIQKLNNWSEAVKKYWDEDSISGINIKLILSGSSRLLIQQGLTESLQGRFEVISVTHWTYSEMSEAFGFSLDDYIFFGAYPGAATLIGNEERWRNYIRESIIETSISKDILMMTKVVKPALLRQLFNVACIYSAQIMSLNKLLGELDDAGNTTTLSGYLALLDQCGFICGLQRYSDEAIRSKASIPKFAVYNNALMSASISKSFTTVRNDSALWGRFVESAVAAHLLNSAVDERFGIYYWRHNNDEVDFIISKNENIAALEVKSGTHTNAKGLSKLLTAYPYAKVYTISYQQTDTAIDLERFLKINPAELL